MATYTNGLNLEALTWALKALSEKRADYQKARDFYSGKHPLDFVTDKFKSAFGDKFSAMKINLCPTVVDIPSNRMIIAGFSAKLAIGDSEGAKARAEAIADEARVIWEMNRMDARAGGVMKESFKTGDSYVIVWPDEADDGTLSPIFYPQLAGTCAVQSDAEKPGYIVRAVKWWVEGKRVRLNIYTGSEIEKYEATKDGALLPAAPTEFQRYKAKAKKGKTEVWPLSNPWSKCPVFHFPNGDERKSELSEVYEPQGGLNLTTCNLIVSMEYFAYPQRYVLGYDPRNDDPDDKGIAEWKAAMNRIWFHAGDKNDIEMGQFNPSDPGAYLEIMREFRALISEVSGLPPYYFSMSGAVPSGVALQILEKRLTDKVGLRKTMWGNPWADMMLLALKMKGRVSDADGVRLGTEWRDTAPKDAQGEANTQAAKQAAGVSQRQSLREMGYSDARIDEMRDERAEERAGAGDLLGAAFNGGMV